jgi:TPR repeat protein
MDDLLSMNLLCRGEKPTSETDELKDVIERTKRVSASASGRSGKGSDCSLTEKAPTSCATCGKAGEETASCGVCKLSARFCGRACHILHEFACKKQAAKELYDEALFRQPPKADECPICFLPLPGLGSGQTFKACCGKTICMGCYFEHEKQSNGSPTCPFCRACMPSEEEFMEMMKKRVDANDADAILQLGMSYFSGEERFSIKKDTDKAAKLLHRAADLEFAKAYGSLAAMYLSKDKTKAKQYFEKAAMAGCTDSRLNLGRLDAHVGRFDRAIKHWLIAASGGEIMAVNEIKKAMSMGKATKDEYAQALRGYEQCCDEIRSELRDRAAAYSDEYKYLCNMISKNGGNLFER